MTEKTSDGGTPDAAGTELPKPAGSVQDAGSVHEVGSVEVAGSGQGAGSVQKAGPVEAAGSVEEAGSVEKVGLAGEPTVDDQADEPADAWTVAAPAQSSSTRPGAGSGVDVDPLVPAVIAPPPDYSEAGVPSLDFVRDKIEGRYAKSLGSTELAQETPEARSFEEQAAKRAESAKEKLDAIRRSLRGDA